MLFQSVRNDRWLETEVGSYVFSRQEKLIVTLLDPAAEETLLDIGCGTGNFLRLFQRKKCLLTGTDASREALEKAREKIGVTCDFVEASPANLPFSDDEFDVVTLINGLHGHDDPEKVIAEAVRVCRGRLFVGFLNKHSLAGTPWSIRKLFGLSGIDGVNLFSVREMLLLIAKTMRASSVHWGSVIYLPIPFYTFFSELEEMFPMNRNPLGAFVGMVIPVRYTYRTLQEPARNGFALKGKTRPVAADVARGCLKERDG